MFHHIIVGNDGESYVMMESRMFKLKKENAYAADGSSYLEAKKQKFKEISKINKRAKRK